MKPEPKKKLPNKKVISSAKFEAKEQFTKSALENLKTENERLVNSPVSYTHLTLPTIFRV